MSLTSLLNAVFNLPQAWKIWTEHTAAGLALSTSWMMLVVQVVFTFHGWLKRDRFLSYSGTAACSVTTLIILGQYTFR